MRLLSALRYGVGVAPACLVLAPAVAAASPPPDLNMDGTWNNTQDTCPMSNPSASVLISGWNQSTGSFQGSVGSQTISGVEQGTGNPGVDNRTITEPKPGGGTVTINGTVTQPGSSLQMSLGPLPCPHGETGLVYCVNSNPQLVGSPPPSQQQLQQALAQAGSAATGATAPTQVVTLDGFDLNFNALEPETLTVTVSFDGSTSGSSLLTFDGSSSSGTGVLTFAGTAQTSSLQCIRKHGHSKARCQKFKAATPPALASLTKTFTAAGKASMQSRWPASGG